MARAADGDAHPLADEFQWGREAGNGIEGTTAMQRGDVKRQQTKATTMVDHGWTGKETREWSVCDAACVQRMRWRRREGNEWMQMRCEDPSMCPRRDETVSTATPASRWRGSTHQTKTDTTLKTPSTPPGLERKKGRDEQNEVSEDA